MKKIITLHALLLTVVASATLYAQTGTRPANAPPRKTTPAAKPATPPKPAVAPASSAAPARPGNTLAPAEGRTNSTALPAPVQTTTPTRAQPAPTVSSEPSRKRSSRTFSSASGDLAYEKGDKLLNVGVGLSSYYYGNPLGISFEIGVDNDISVGGQFDYNAGTDNYDDRYTATYFGVRGSYHFNRLLQLNTNKVDVYAGAGLGYRTFRWNDSYYGSTYSYGSGVFANYFIGGKYYFNNKLGGFLELGYTGISRARIGLSAKF